MIGLNSPETGGMAPQARIALYFLLFACCAFTARAQETPRKTIWDLRLGEPLSAQPDAGEYQGYACGANGGPPRQPISGFADFASCAPEPNGLREVYFEYDDELEYIARARDLKQELIRYVGTTEKGFPVMVSALLDQDGVLQGLRMVTDARPDQRKDRADSGLKSRANAYQFGGLMAGRFDIEAESHCEKLKPEEGESAVGGTFVKLDCAKADAASKRSYKLSARLLRKPGQNGRDPRLPTRLTVGEFESSARLEIFASP